MSWGRDDGNPKCDAHEGFVSCYVRDALTDEWRELGGKWVPHPYLAGEKAWKDHPAYLYENVAGGQTSRPNLEHDRDAQDTVDDVGAACSCGWRGPRIQFNPGLIYRDCSHYELRDAGYEDVVARLREMWDQHMDECCGQKWTDEQYRKYQREQHELKINARVRAELEEEARRRAKFDEWGRFQKKEKRIPRPVTDRDIQQARHKEPWRWYR